MKKVLLPIVYVVVGAGLGLGLDRLVISSQPAPAPAPIQPQAAGPQPAPPSTVRIDDPKAVYRVTLDDSPAKGPRDAPITIVESLDFECPYCKQVAPTLKQVEEVFPGKVRFVFKHNPLSGMHKNALPAAMLAEEARAEGGDAKFWAAHDKLLAAQSLDRVALEKIGADLKLSYSRVQAALDGSKYSDRTGRDQRAMAVLGATGTPTFFVNGRKLVGAQPLGSFKALIGQELEKAEGMIKAGTSAKDLYAKLIEKGATERVMTDAPAPAAPAAQPSAQAAQAAQASKIPVRADEALKGPASAPVTVVLFSDFQCPFCGKVEPTLKQLEEAYPGKLRFAWRHQPLPFHPNAMPAAKASEAARAQGKFWEMHDKLFANQQALSEATYTQYAKELKLDLSRFQRDQSAEGTTKRITEDQQLASSVGADGTPTLFVNCRKMVGAQPFDAFKTVVEEELKKAEAAIARGEKAGPGLYDKLCAANVAAAPPLAQDAGPRKDVVVAIRPDDPVRGKKDARVTVVEFSDFQCPFCSKAVGAVKELEESHPKDVRVVWKHMPLSFHANALPAAAAAEAARQQGKFWEMHDKLFANQQSLSQTTYEQYAKDLGLDLSKFRSAVSAQSTTQRINEDVRVAGSAGVNGTPTFVVNGEVVVGSGALRAAVERQIEKARVAKR